MRLNAAFAFILVTAMAATGCSLFEETKKPPMPGDRVSVLELQNALEPEDPGLAAQGLVMPGAWQNEYWPQAGGYPNHSMQNLSLNEGALKRVWQADIGEGSTEALPLTAQPVAVDGRVFTLDTDSRLSAFDAKTGKTLWTKNVRKEKEEDPVIGGGIAYGGGALYVTNGYDELLAIKPADGKVFWRKRIGAPSRGAPTILDGRVFVSTIDNRLLALNAATGEKLWDYTGLAETTGIIGAASPAAGHDIVIPVFSSGDVTALRVENGSIAWSDNLSGAARVGNLDSIADIKALPVIDKGLVIAISYSGRLVAIDERTGTRVWQREIGGSNTPWVAGNHLYVLSSDNELVALGRDTGTIRWVAKFPRMEEDSTVLLTGPVLAGGRLFVFGNQGRAYEISPDSGKVLGQWDSDASILISPIVAAGTLYTLSEDGYLSAYR